MTGFQMRQLVVNGVRSPVLIGGAGAPGEAVVFVHGNPGAGSDWEPLMEHVAEFATVVAPDMPGFGGANKRADQDYTLAAYGTHLGG
jgi:pimeloyl-ACP methyl ester carboxylesterase